MGILSSLEEDSFLYRVLSRIWLAASYLWCVYSASMRDKVNVHASSCTYYFLVSLIPILIITGWVAKNVLAAYAIMPFIEGLPFYPEIQQLMVSMNVPTPSLGAIGIFGALYGLWCASALLRGVAGAFRAIFGAKSIKKSIIVTMATYVFIPLFLVAAIMFASVSSLVVDLINWLLADTLHIMSRAASAAFLTNIISIAFIVMGAYSGYMLLASVRPKSYAAFTAAVLFGLYFYILQNVLSSMTANLFVKYSIYGALGTVLLVLLWAFLIFLGLFIMAELAAVMSIRPSAVYIRYIYISLKAQPKRAEGIFMNRLPFAYQRYVIKLEKGETLEAELSMLVVRKGSVTVEYDGQKETLEAGRFFMTWGGYMRKVAVQANSLSGVIVVTEEELSRLVVEFPDSLSYIRDGRVNA